jgi:nucleotide-binding universal stress UspA family protein
MKMKGRPILVGVDDPEPSRHAAVLGFRVARATESSLHQVTATLDALAEITAARLGRVLVDAAKGLRSGSIVIGGKGRRGLSPWLCRGAAHHLLRRLDPPLLVVPCVPRAAEVAP